MQRTYEKNAELIRELYNSSFGKKHMEQPFFKYMIEAMYSDPDTFDVELKKKANALTKKFKVEIGADGICGWKLLFDLYGGNDSDEWIEKYEIIRQSSIGTLFWPCRENGGKTINVERSNKFGDRIDLTLYDIKRYIAEKPTKMSFDNKDTTAFFERYLKEEGGFGKFISDFELTKFVVENNGSYEIYDLAEKDYQTNYINDKKCDNFIWSNRFGCKRKKERLGNYIENIIKILEQSV